MLSIGKLSHLTQAEPDGSVLDAFDDNLDFVSVHEVILDQFHAVLEKQRGRQSLDTQIDRGFSIPCRKPQHVEREGGLVLKKVFFRVIRLSKEREKRDKNLSRLPNTNNND